MVAKHQWAVGRFSFRALAMSRGHETDGPHSMALHLSCKLGEEEDDLSVSARGSWSKEVIDSVSSVRESASRHIL